MFYRKILIQLEKWKQKPNRKPLILRGARQTGKTTVIKEFSKKFDHFLHFNLEQKIDHDIFQKEISIDDLVKEIFFLYRHLFYIGKSKFQVIYDSVDLL